jgi:class 3 adenylate cyclase
VSELPSGTVTFLFTDLEFDVRGGGRTRWPALARHDAIVRHAIEGHDGYVVKTTGDGFMRSAPPTMPWTRRSRRNSRLARNRR